MNIEPSNTWRFTSRLDWQRLFRDFAPEGATVGRISSKQAPEGRPCWTLVKGGTSAHRRCVKEYGPAPLRSRVFNVYADPGDRVREAVGAKTFKVETWVA